MLQRALVERQFNLNPLRQSQVPERAPDFAAEDGRQALRQPRRAQQLLPGRARLDPFNQGLEFGLQTGHTGLPLLPLVQPRLCGLPGRLQRLDRHAADPAHAQLQAVLL